MGFRQWRVLVLNDFRIEWRRKDRGFLMVGFGILEVFLFSLSFNVTPRLSENLAPGILWMGFLFAGMLTVTRSYSHEVPYDVLTGLTLAAGGRGIVLASKLTVSFLFMMTTELSATLGWLGAWPMGRAIPWGLLFLVLSLGGLGIVSAGLLMAAINVSMNGYDTVLAVVLLALEVPVSIAAVQATTSLWRGGHPWIWIHGLMAFDAMFVALMVLLFDSLWEV